MQSVQPLRPLQRLRRWRPRWREACSVRSIFSHQHGPDALLSTAESFLRRRPPRQRTEVCTIPFFRYFNYRT